jgi:hypothetical protein
VSIVSLKPFGGGRICLDSIPRWISGTSAGVHLLDVVALTADVPEKGLPRGQVGTVVEMLAPGVFEVEFSDDAGRTYAQAALPEAGLMVLFYEPRSGV